MNSREWLASGEYFNYKQNRIFKREGGKGETLVLIHGFPTASYDWHKVWQQLTTRFHVITIDMIGFGFSDKPQKHKYSLFEQADIFEYLLMQKGILKYHILAHDYGDTVAQELLARQLTRQQSSSLETEILSVCFLNGGIIPGEHRPRLIQRLLMSPIGKWIGLLSSRSTLRRNFQAIFGKNTQPTAAEIDDFWDLMTYNDGKKVIHKLIWYMDERVKHKKRWVGAMQNSTLPMIMINGIEDPISGKHSADKFAELVPQASVHYLENIGHYPQTESPEELLRIYFLFFTKL
jgi:pimeloyl-ACP methyl ester carboxylesterase